LKSEWAITKTDWLRHYLTPTRPKPWHHKTKPILALAPLQSLKQLCAFTNAVNFYKDYWKNCTHMMVPLTSLTQTPTFNAFNAVKDMIAHGDLLTYPDPKESFDIEINASNYQLGAVIKQIGCPVVFFTQNFTGMERNYMTIQKELLSIVEMLTTFSPILHCSKICVWTNCANLTFTQLSLQQVLCWRLFIEE
jgi:hypothetical protein